MSFFDHVIRLGYSRDLHQQLKGLSADCEGYTGNSLYQLTSIIMLAVSLVIMLNYYYGLFNNPRFTHRWVWLVNLVVACFITGGFAYSRAVSYLPDERHCTDIHFTLLDCSLFAFTVMVYTAVICILLSLVIKWKSISNKKIPF